MLEVRIEAVDDEGAGVGPGGGRSVHVAGALPGEVVRAATLHRSPHRPESWARLVEVLEPSPARREPPCPAHGRCGGCPLQHAAYDEQLRLKRARVERALARHPSLHGVVVAACVPAPAETRYRDQAKYVVARLKGRTVPASYAPRSHRPVDMTGCLVPEAPVQAAAEAAVAAAAALGVPVYDERRRTGLLRYVVSRANSSGQTLVVLVAAADFPEAEALARGLRARCPFVVGVILDVNTASGGVILGGAGRVLDGVDEVEEDLGGVRLVLGARAFFQVNRAQAARLYVLCAELAALRPTDVLLDLYSGVGGIALTLAPRAARVIGIEASAAAVASARRAASAASSSCEFRCGDVAPLLAEVAHADVVVLDPPRKGCAPAVLVRLAALAPRRIVYVSCDPRSLARDLDRLAALGYRTSEVQPLDLFPGTAHVECVAALSRE
ncbi:MAG: 23S rRNA (uracil(1939)-C(5))-methyltransferase RlmD [Deltaproteobacteria bacterium]|nr:23S rRNA (uracil(1939)-C(5))-methyltransferase RlmD [Deltaproteobacteria bacterium]